MSQTWQQPYSELKKYIAQNPEIEIKPDIMIIPAGVRPEFYRLFDAVRTCFITERHQAELDEAAALGGGWNTLEPEVRASLDISEIRLPLMLRSLMQSPLEALCRPLFDLLFDLLKDKIDAVRFEQEVEQKISAAFPRLLREGYEKWLLLALISLLAPDAALAIPLEEIRDRLHDLQFTQWTGCEEVELPPVKKAANLILGSDGEQVSFVTASALVHSKRLDSYVSLTQDMAYAVRSTPSASYNREWLQLRPLGQSGLGEREWPDMVLHADEQPDEIALVTDFSRFLRPDVIVECAEQPIQNDNLEKVKRDYDYFKPRKGSFVASRLPLPEGFPGDPAHGDPAPDGPRNIRVLEVGYDRSRLEPIILALSKDRPGAGTS